MIDRIRDTGIFRNALVVEIDLAVFIDSHIFQQGISFYRVVDIRFGFLVQIDDLGIAAAFKIEYAVIVPAVLVVADQQTSGLKCGIHTHTHIDVMCRGILFSHKKEGHPWEFSGSPVLRVQPFHSWGLASIPGWRSCQPCGMAKIKKEKKEILSFVTTGMNL